MVTVIPNLGGLLDIKPGIFPGLETAGDVIDLLKPFAFHNACSNTRSVPATTVNGDRLLGIKIQRAIDTITHFRNETVFGSFDAGTLVLAW